MNTNGRRGFTLIEMLVVVGIIAIITAASMTAYTKFVRHAQRVRGIENVHQIATALTSILQNDGCWPRSLLVVNKNGNKLDATAGAALAKSGTYTLTYATEKREDGSLRYVLSGHDRFGVVDPWAMDAIKKSRSDVKLSMQLPAGGTISDHIFRCAIDEDMDGLVIINNPEVGTGAGIKVRASACVWGCGRDGRFGTDDDLHSWGKGMEVLE